jgi:hypothetical protein
MDYVPFTADEIELLYANSFYLFNNYSASDTLLRITKLKQGFEVSAWLDDPDYGEGYWSGPNLYPTIKSAIGIL